MFDWIKKYLSPVYAIRIASDFTTILSNNKVVLRKPSCVAKKDTYLVAGYDYVSSKYYIPIEYPIHNNRIQNFSDVEFMVKYFIKKILKHNWIKPQILLIYPSPYSEMEQRAVCSIFNEITNRVNFYSDSRALIYSLSRFKELNNLIIINIDYDCVKLVIAKNDNILVEKEIDQGFYSIKEFICNKLSVKYNIKSGFKSIDSFLKEYQTKESLNVYGLCKTTNLPQEIHVSSDEIKCLIHQGSVCLSHIINQIIDKLKCDYDIEEALIISECGYIHALAQQLKLPFELIENSSSIMLEGAFIAHQYNIKKK